MKNLSGILFMISTLLLFTVGCGNDQSPKVEQLANIIHITQKSELDKILKSEKTVLLDFYADWCGPCVKMEPELKALAKADKDIKIVKIDVDKAKELANEYKIQSIPSLFVYKDGKKSNSSLGFMDQQKLKAFVGSNAKVENSKACCPH